ncbi:MAG: LPXTG-motif cell wall-anchored protein [Arenicella sp.]|jgi:LPXTG-motif cell wall-anchored protein
MAHIEIVLLSNFGSNLQNLQNVKEDGDSNYVVLVIFIVMIAAVLYYNYRRKKKH